MKEELKALSSNSITDIDKESVTLTYDCGDADDAGKFENKARDILDKAGFNYDLTSSPSDPEDGEAWTIIDINIAIEDINIDSFAQTLTLLDQI